MPRDDWQSTRVSRAARRGQRDPVEFTPEKTWKKSKKRNIREQIVRGVAATACFDLIRSLIKLNKTDFEVCGVVRSRYPRHVCDPMLAAQLAKRHLVRPQGPPRSDREPVSTEKATSEAQGEAVVSPDPRGTQDSAVKA